MAKLLEARKTHQSSPSRIEPDGSVGGEGRQSQRRAAWVGGLLGLAAAGSGLAAPFLGVRPWHVLLLAAAVFALSGSRMERLKHTQVRAVDLAFILYVGALCLSEIINTSQLHYTFDFAGIFANVLYFTAYLSARSVVSDYLHARRFLATFVAPIFLVAPLAIGQSAGATGVTNLLVALAPGQGMMNRLEGGGLTRATGLIGHWTGFGAYLVVIVAACVALIAMARVRGWRGERYGIAALVATLLALVATLTFSMIITGAVVIVACAGIAQFRRQVVVLFGCVAIGGAALFSTVVQERLDQQFAEKGYGGIEWLPDWVPDTIQYRVRVWTEQTIPMVLDRPATGWGSQLYESVYRGGVPGRTYPDRLVWHSPESQYLGAAMGEGLVGLAFQLGLFATFALLLIAASRAGHSVLVAKPLLVVFALALVAALTVSIFSNRGFPVAFWPMLGVVSGIYYSSRDPSCLSKTVGRRGVRGRRTGV